MRKREAPLSDVPLDVPFCTGSQWFSLDVTGFNDGEKAEW